jgi:hypothetical protein
MYARRNYKLNPTAPAGSDDEITTYAYTLGLKAGFGPVTFEAEFNDGKNWGDQDFLGIGIAANNGGMGGAMPYLETTTGKQMLADTDMMGYWGDLAFKFGPATAHLIYGSQRYETNNYLVQGIKCKQRTQMYGVSVPIAVAKTFIIRPELMWYDLDQLDFSGYNANADRDLGKYWIGGLQFQIVF